MATNERVVNGVKTRLLHNKDYVEVAERTRILHELRKAGEIKEFEMVESEPREIVGRVYWRVSARIDGKLYIGDAEVKLDAPKNTPDGTNPFECAETSAFGRMLAFAGLGTVESLASYDEIARGEPYVAVVEQATSSRVVEAGAPAHRQIQPPAMASSTSPKAAQAKQEPSLAQTNHMKVEALLDEYKRLQPEKCTARGWYHRLLREVWRIQEGPLPVSDAYTPEHVVALAQYVGQSSGTASETTQK